MFRLVALEDASTAPSAPLRHGDSLGRLATSAFAVAHPSVSRVHARVEQRGSDWFVVDAGSRNGLVCRGERVAEVRLVDGLELRLGEYAVRVEEVAEARPSAPPRVAAPVPIAESFEFDLPGEPAAAGVELEDPAEIELGTANAGDAPRPAPRAAARSTAQVRQAEFLAEESRARAGLVRGELTQQPFWVQGLVWLGVLGFGALVAALVVGVL
jgi:hypothetical protein